MDRSVPVGAPVADAGAVRLPAVPAVEVSRRRLLQAGAGLAAAAATGGAVRLLEDLGSGGLRGLRRSDWAPYVGRSVRLSGPGAVHVPALLAAVEVPRGGGTPSAREDAFVLVFHAAPGRRRLEQAIMNVRHPAGWTVPLLVSPAGTGRHGLDYSASVNRTTPNQETR